MPRELELQRELFQLSLPQFDDGRDDIARTMRHAAAITRFETAA